MGSLPAPPSSYNPKMHPHIVALALCLPLASATIEIAAGGAGGALILTAAQAQLLTLIALAGKLGVGLAAGGFLLSRRGRGKRAAVEENFGVTLEQLAALEVDDCYKRLFCSAAAGGLGGAEGVEQLLLLVGPDASTQLRAPGSKQAKRIKEAAVFGMSRRDVAKCEHHYQCSVKTSDIVRMFAGDS